MLEYEVEDLIYKLNSFKNKNFEDFKKFSKNINSVNKDLYIKHLNNSKKNLITEDFLIKLKDICQYKKL